MIAIKEKSPDPPPAFAGQLLNKKSPLLTLVCI